MEISKKTNSDGLKDVNTPEVSDGVEDKEQQIRQIRINICVNCLVWVFTYTAFTGLQNLQSSLNHDLGTYALGSITAGTCIVCLISPIIISRLGCKHSLTVSWVCLCLFLGANYQPEAYLMIPAAFVEGIATGLAWTAQGVYVTTSAAHYAALTGKSMDSVLSALFGIFFMASQSTQVWGNLISSAVLQFSDDTLPELSSNSSNMTTINCGALNCPVSSLDNSWMVATMELDFSLRYILLSVFMASAVTGLAITVLFLQPMKERVYSPSSSTLSLLLSTLTLLKSNLNMILLVPLFLYVGLQQALMFAEFTKAYVTCSIGIGWVGYTMLCFGVCVTILSPVSGVLGRYLRRSILLTWALLLNLVMLVVMLLWKPSSSDKYMYFLVPAVWGMADAVWQTQSCALIGSIFYDDQEAAFANLRMFVSLGKTLAYLYSATLCEYVKLYIAGGLVIVAVLLHTVVEIRTQNKIQLEYKSIDG